MEDERWRRTPGRSRGVHPGLVLLLLLVQLGLVHAGSVQVEPQRLCDPGEERREQRGHVWRTIRHNKTDSSTQKNVHSIYTPGSTRSIMISDQRSGVLSISCSINSSSLWDSVDRDRDAVSSRTFSQM